jgi:hypothetical protein
MTTLYGITMGVLCAVVMILAAFGVLIAWHSHGRVGRWWRFVRGQSRNRKK